MGFGVVEVTGYREKESGRWSGLLVWVAGVLELLCESKILEFWIGY